MNFNQFWLILITDNLILRTGIRVADGCQNRTFSAHFDFFFFQIAPYPGDPPRRHFQKRTFNAHFDFFFFSNRPLPGGSFFRTRIFWCRDQKMAKIFKFYGEICAFAALRGPRVLPLKKKLSLRAKALLKRPSKGGRFFLIICRY